MTTFAFALAFGSLFFRDVVPLSLAFFLLPPSCADLGLRPNFSPSFLPGEREGEGGKVSARTRARGANARSAGVPATVQKEQMQRVRGGEHLLALYGET
jgi:hypothetical protein